MRKPEEIQRQVDGLLSMKEWLPEENFFGDNNWKTIDAQVSILKEEKTSEEIEEEFEEDGLDCPTEIWDVESWMLGNYEDDLFEEQ